MNCQEYWNTVPELCDVEGNRHLRECPDCATRMSRHRELEAGLRAVAAGFRRMEAPPRVEARLRSAFRRQAGMIGSPAAVAAPSRRWIPAVTWAAAFAAMFMLGALLVRSRQPEAARPPLKRTIEVASVQPRSDYEGFIALPNSVGLATDLAADDEEVNLVRVEVPRSAMIALGLEVSAERAGDLVEADVLLSSNGLARAVRFLD